MDPCLFCCTSSANTRRSAVKIEVDDAYPSAPSLSTSDSESSRESTPSLPSVTDFPQEQRHTRFANEVGTNMEVDTITLVNKYETITSRGTIRDAPQIHVIAPDDEILAKKQRKELRLWLLDNSFTDAKTLIDCGGNLKTVLNITTRH